MPSSRAEIRARARARERELLHPAASDSDSDDPDAVSYSTLLALLPTDARFEPLLKRRKLQEQGADQSDDDEDEDGEEHEYEQDGTLRLSKEQAERLLRERADEFELVEEGEHDSSEDSEDYSDDDEEEMKEEGDREEELDASEGEEEQEDDESEGDDGKLDVCASSVQARLFSRRFGLESSSFSASSSSCGGPVGWRRSPALSAVAGGDSGRIRVSVRHPEPDPEPNVLKGLEIQRLRQQWPYTLLNVPAQAQTAEAEDALIQQHMAQYGDVLHCCRGRGPFHPIVDVYTLHVLQHLYRSRRLRAPAPAPEQNGTETETETETRDQGFTRASVLVLLPFRSSALAFVHKLLKLLPEATSGKVHGLERFEADFGSGEREPERQRLFDAKPQLYKDVFVDNIDDCFKFGVAFTKRGIRLYSDFYESDIIVASPLSLRMVVGTDGDASRDFDFLSSIEILVIDQADVLAMQNFDHVNAVVDCLNRLPTETRDTDITRVREFNLDGHASLRRQSLVFSSLSLPQLNTLSRRFSNASSGSVRVSQAFDGVLSGVQLPVRQLFRRLNAAAANAAVEERFRVFSKEILPQLTASLSSHILIFVPSYFDFVRVRNHMKRLKLSVSFCSEYSEKRCTSRARALFSSGARRFLVVSERFLYFRRYRIRGARSLLLYGLPHEPSFYSDMLNVLEDSDDGERRALVLYSRFDSQALERVLGSNRAARLLAADKEQQLFV